MKYSIIMKSIGAVFIIFLSVLLMGNNYSKKSLDNLLKQFRWEKRVLLLVTHSNGTKLVKKVDAFFGNNKCQNKNRNIKLIRIIGNDLEKYEMPIRYANKTGIWLIGYDGNDKAYSSDFSLLDQVHSIIDSMPIRKNEMLYENSNCG